MMLSSRIAHAVTLAIYCLLPINSKRKLTLHQLIISLIFNIEIDISDEAGLHIYWLLWLYESGRYFEEQCDL